MSDRRDEWDDVPYAGSQQSDSSDPLGLLEEEVEESEAEGSDNSVPRRPVVIGREDNSKPKRPSMRPVSPVVEKEASEPEDDSDEDDIFNDSMPVAGAPLFPESDTGETVPSSSENVVWVEAGSSLPDVGEEVDVDLDDEDDESETDKPVASKTSKSKKSSRKKKPLAGIRLTERDIQMLEFLGRYRYATVSQLARRFETGEKTLRNRLPKLRESGLVESVFIVHARPSVWLVTSAGLNVIGMNLTAPSIRWGQVRHTMLLTELGITFELANENVLTEREIRAAATRYSPTPRMKASVDFYKSIEQLEQFEEESEVDTRVTSALTIPVPGRGIGHIPDMVLARQPFPNGSSGSIAIELELTRKNLGEWRTVLTAFRDSDRFNEVYYFVTSNEVLKAVKRVVKAIGAEDKIHVRMYEPEDETARMFTGTE